MLTYEALIEQARLRQMPATKGRGILREYLQVLIMKELYRSETGRKLFFTGGTYLRLVKNIRRFSEDLDFNSKGMTESEFEKLLETIVSELLRKGLKCSMVFSHRDSLLNGSLIFPEVESFYSLSSSQRQKQGISIKIETYAPKWKVKTETLAISGFGEIFPVITTGVDCLFADKIDAIREKNRGRHLYDIMFMLANKYPVNAEVLKSLGVKQDPKNAILDRVKSLSKMELIKQAEGLRPFLFDEKDAENIVNAHILIPSLLEKY